jgi:hypothetical protein
MPSKSQARLNKRKNAAATLEELPIVRDDARPTDERLARGQWTTPNASGAYVDRACDMIGRLLVENLITDQQAQSARMFSEVYAAYRQEIGIQDAKSCIAESSGGFDPGDGNPAVYRRYYAMCDKMIPSQVSRLQTECDKDADAKPQCLSRLRFALNCLAW